MYYNMYIVKVYLVSNKHYYFTRREWRASQLNCTRLPTPCSRQQRCSHQERKEAPRENHGPARLSSRSKGFIFRHPVKAVCSSVWRVCARDGVGHHEEERSGTVRGSSRPRSFSGEVRFKRWLPETHQVCNVYRDREGYSTMPRSHNSQKCDAELSSNHYHHVTNKVLKYIRYVTNKVLKYIMDTPSRRAA